MNLNDLHPEDVRAAIRKKHGTIRNFAKAEGISEKGIHDVLRGRTSQKIAAVINNLLSEQYESTNADRSKDEG